MFRYTVRLHRSNKVSPVASIVVYRFHPLTNKAGAFQSMHVLPFKTDALPSL
jgi:hypothetical protein